MLNLLSLTVVLPLLGAAGIFLASALFSKLDVEGWRFWTFIVALAVAVLTFAFALVLKGYGGATAVLSSSRPALLAESIVKFHLEPGLWPLAVALSLATCSFLLAELGHKTNPSLPLAVISLALLAIGLAALWSSNPLTTIVSWALYDLFFLLGQIAAGARKGEIIRALALGSVAGLLLWMGVLVAGNGTGSVQWLLMPAGGAKMTFWMLAGLLRLGVYPLHFSTPSGADTSSPLAATLHLGPAIGWGLWARLAVVHDGALPVSSWVMVPALLTLLAGGLLGWTAKSSRGARPWIGMGANGAVLSSSVLASLSGGASGLAEDAPLSILVLGVTGWMLGITALFLGGGLALPESWRRRALPLTVPSMVGAFSLIGAPLTLGFVAESSLIRELARSGQWGWSAGFLVGQTFLVGAVARWLFPPTETGNREVRTFGRVAHAAGLVGPALLLFIAGLVPSLLFSASVGPTLLGLFTRPNLVGWSLWAVPLLLGGALGWQDGYLRPKISLWLVAFHDVVRLDWACDLLAGAFDRGLSIVRTADDILGGRGALLWSVIMLLILFLAWGAR